MKKQYYKDKISAFDDDLMFLSKKIKNISIIRLMIVLLGFVVIYFAFSYSNTFGLIALILIIIFFIWIVRKHNKIFSEKERVQNLLYIYKNEVDLFTTSNLFGTGENFKNPSHEYSSDLDIFGKYSLFNLINRTATYDGESLLSKWLLNPLKDKSKVFDRQQIIKELSEKEDFKEKFLSAFFIAEKTEKESENIQNWVSVFQYYFTEKNFLKIALCILSFITAIVSFGGFVYPSLWSYAIILLIINFFIVAKYRKPVDLVHNHISKQEDIFLKYSELVKVIKNETFQSSHLIGLQKKLLAQNQIENQLKYLSKLIKNLDYRLNFLLSPILNLFLFWDIQYAYKIEKWMSDNSQKIPKWLEIIGEFDALLSLSVLRYNNSDWVFPEISTEELIIEGKSIGHPLIAKKDRVSNDYCIKGKGKFDIVTGSNMAGKSTFLRTIGLNVILGLNGCPVCAKSFTISNVRLITYMRIIDSLEDNLSTFHAELERIKSILNYVEENDNCFLLLDELLRGTNSQDRHIGTVALIKQMMQNKASGIIATHDLGLTDMVVDYPKDIRNYNFGVKTKDEELFFDYKLTNGVCDSFNASILMKKIGIKFDKI